MAKVDIVLGDDCMGLYKDDQLVVAGVKLTFGDILEGLGISCDIWEADLDVYTDARQLPQKFHDVRYPDDEEEEAHA